MALDEMSWSVGRLSFSSLGFAYLGSLDLTQVATSGAH